VRADRRHDDGLSNVSCLVGLEPLDAISLSWSGVLVRAELCIWVLLGVCCQSSFKIVCTNVARDGAIICPSERTKLRQDKHRLPPGFIPVSRGIFLALKQLLVWFWIPDWFVNCAQGTELTRVLCLPFVGLVRQLTMIEEIKTAAESKTRSRLIYSF